MSQAIAFPAVEVAARSRARTLDGPVVSALDLSRRYGEGSLAVDALRGVTLDVEPGQLTAVMGPSGSGKSTLLHCLAGIVTPDSGSVTYNGAELSTMDDVARSALRRLRHRDRYVRLRG